jgi:hypothetical protein
MNKLQIAVFGSTADLRYGPKIEKIAEETGYLIAKNGGVLIFGFEKDTDSLSTAAFRGAKKANGLTVGVTYGRREHFTTEPDVLITSGMERGGGREYVLAANCDAAIAISGGSGTLNEIAVAYQLNIPVVAILNTGGWAAKLAGQYLDQRKRYKILPAANPKEAVTLAFKLAKKKK